VNNTTSLKDTMCRWKHSVPKGVSDCIIEQASEILQNKGQKIEELFKRQKK
jgi:hypothetical protein